MTLPPVEVLCRWLRSYRPDQLTDRVRPLALPVGHVLHAGEAWPRVAVPGGVLDLGLGLVDVDPDRPEAIVPVPTPVVDALGWDLRPWWSVATDYLGRMAFLAGRRWGRDPTAPLRPLGDCDVVTLLAAATFRGVLACTSGGMCPVAVPLRRRGWIELRRLDPAFAVAAAAATDPVDRGFDRPVLVTVDEVMSARAGGRPAEIDLRDPAPARQLARAMPYR